MAVKSAAPSASNVAMPLQIRLLNVLQDEAESSSSTRSHEGLGQVELALTWLCSLEKVVHHMLQLGLCG